MLLSQDFEDRWLVEVDFASADLKLIEHLHDAPDAMPLQEQRETPALMIAATAGMVAVSVLLTVAAGPLYAYATRAGEQ